MEKQYILFIVLNDTKRYKDIKKKFKALDYNRYTAIDTVGSTCFSMCNNMEFSQMFSSSMGEMDNKKYNKTIFLVLESEEEVERIMDEIEDTLNLNPKKPGKGIMFSIPIYKSHGVRYENK